MKEKIYQIVNNPYFSWTCAALSILIILIPIKNIEAKFYQELIAVIIGSIGFIAALKEFVNTIKGLFND